MTLALLHHD